MFSKAGDIKRIVMGLDKMQSTPCGFCFVVYYTRADTEDCCKYINGMTLDERLIRVDFDWGFRDGRQFGRGKSGGQVRGGRGPRVLGRGLLRCLLCIDVAMARDGPNLLAFESQPMSRAASARPDTACECPVKALLVFMALNFRRR